MHQELKIVSSAHRVAYNNSIPWFVTIELTLNCNLKCLHCYNFDRQSAMPDQLKVSMSKDRVLKLIDELKKAGTLMIAFSGGEALLDPNLFEYIKKARENSLLVKIKSNGTLFNLEKAKQLKSLGVYGVDISLYGANEYSHDYITNINGSFKNTIDGIKILRSLNINVSISYILYKKNYLDIQKMIDLATDLKAEHSFSTELTKRYDNTSINSNLALDHDDLIYLLKSEFKEIFGHTNEDQNLQCECARTVCGIGANGNLYPCIGAPIYSGNLIDNSFEDIWKNSKVLNSIRNLEKKDFKTCSSCNLIEHCGRSSGGAYVNTGNYTGKNPEDCQMAHARKDALGL